MAALTIGIAVVGAVTSFVAQKRQAAAIEANAKLQNAANAKLVANSKEQERLRQEEARRQNDKARRTNLRNFLQQRGRDIAGAAIRGTVGSTGLQGVLGGLASQFASNEGNITRGERTAEAFGATNIREAEIKGEAFKAQTNLQVRTAQNAVIQNLGDKLFSNAKIIGDDAQSLFKTA